MNRSADALDGYLLRVLCTVADERSVSRAAAKLDQTQPAVSAALKRLREILGDPLLVREKMGMVPTARALQFAAQARLALAELGKLVAEPEAFDAQSAQHDFRIATPDYLAAFFLADVARRLRSEAPGCRLEVHALGADFDFERALAEDRLDVVIGNWPHPPEQLHMSLLLEDEVVCLVSNAHPCVLAGLDEAAYLQAAHVVPMPYSIAQRGLVETHLAQRRVTRDARVTLPYFGLAPYVVAETDMVFTTARALCRALRAAAAARGGAGADGLSAHALLPVVASARASVGSAPLAALADPAAREGAGGAAPEVNFQNAVPVVALWGDGTKGSADMMAMDASRHLWTARVDPRRRTYAAGMYTAGSRRWWPSQARTRCWQHCAGLEHEPH